MRSIDMQSWSRREHFNFFLTFDHPHFNMCANVDMTAFYPAVKERGYSVTAAIVYLIARTANDIPEFRYRIRPVGVVDHEIVHPHGKVLPDLPGLLRPAGYLAGLTPPNPIIGEAHVYTRKGN
ncbi:MAG: hypothetical protein JW726_19645 [Anaerolineales bacterium]|nr:hypothetical protein [Anaerolineales bacterium]